MCAYPVRYWPGIVKLKEMIDSGEYGRVMQMSIWTEQLTTTENAAGKVMYALWEGSSSVMDVTL